MYRIKYNNSTIFDPYDDDEVVTDAKLTQEVNAAAYLDFTISPKHPLYDTVKERDGVVTLEWLSNDDSEEDEKLFEGIIDAITIDFYGYKAISCVSAMDYLNDTIVRPYSTVAGEQPLTAPSSIEGYFQWLIDQHNSHVIDSKKRFGVGINQGASMRRNDFIYRSSTGNPTTSEEISNQILETLGGYLVMRYENGNNVLDLYSDVHEMNAQIIDFGVNLLDFTKTIDTADQYTALIPQGGSPKFTDGGFEDDDSVWNQYPYLNISTDQKHSGDKSAYFTEGNGEFINSTFFYVREGYRYKSTVWVKNERSSAIKVYPRYQVFVGSVWETRTPDGVNPLEVPNDNEWHEFTFDFLPHVSDTTKIRPYWVFDSVANDSNKRVYVDDFNFVRIQGEQELEEDPITVSQMGDGITPFSYDIVKYHDVVYSLDAVQRYGYREKVFSDDTITDEDTLMQEAIRQLNMVMSPTTGIDIKAIDLAMFMKGYKHLQVGQAVRIRSKFHDTDEYLMVSSVNLDLQDPSQTEYELGRAYDSLTGQQSGFLMSLNSGINSSLDAVASLDQTTKDQAIQIGSVEQVANQAQQTADAAQNTANNAQNTANSNKEAIDSIKDAQTEYEKQLEQMQAGVDQAEKEIDGINDRLDQMDTEAGEVQAAIDAVRQEAQTNFETAKNAADAAGQRADAAQKAVDALRESTSSELQNVKDSVSDVRSDVDAVTQKAADLASELDGTKATVEQVVTEQGEIKTTVSNAVEKADQSLKVSTQASQTATQAQTTATSAYEDAQTAITQSSQATQTANQVSLDLRTNYQTKADADAKYATQASLTATSEQIRTEVSETYATQATVNALENLANNAVQTWMGDGVPTLSNKPASDWTTSELKSQHSGDLYYDTNTGYAYRFGSSDGSNYSWALVKDTDITKALADAAKAQETAEGAQSGVNELKTSIPVTYATKSELSQKADSITARVEEVAQAGETTSNKVAELELTADGLQSTVKEQASKLDQQATTISQVSQKADSLSSTITQVSGRVDDVEDKADAAQGTANSAMSQASRVEQSLDSFKTSVSRDYQTKTDALSQKSELEQNINSFKTTVSETYETKTHASDTYLDKNTASSTYTSKTEFTQTTDKISATATAASQNASSALSKVSSLEVSVDGIDAKVEENASDIADAVRTTSQVSQRVDSLSSTITQVQGDIDRIDANSQNFITNPQFKQGNVDGVANTNMNATDSNPGVLPGTATTFGKNFSGYDNRADKVKIKFIKNHTYRIEIDARLASNNAYTGTEGLGLFFWFMTADNPGLSANQYTVYNANLIPSGTKEWTHASYDYTPKMGDDDPRIIFRPAYRVAPGSRWLVTNFTCTDVTAIAEAQKDADTATDTANSALSQSSTVQQELTSFKTSVQQTYETKNDALNKQSSLQQSVNNLRTEVSETYTTKTDFTKLSNAVTKTYQFHGHNVNSQGWHKLGTWSKTDQMDICIITIYAGNGQNGRADQNRELKVYIKKGYQSTASTTGAFGVTIDRIRNADAAQVQVRATASNSCDVWYYGDSTYSAGRYTISIDPDTVWTPTDVYQSASPTTGTLQTQEYQTYSTKSYVDQTSRTVSLGVVEEYKNGQHGSALATQSDITATKNSITSTVSQTYVSKTDASNTYLTKSSATATYATKTSVQQTSDSLTVKIGNILNNPTSDNLWPNQWFDDDKPLFGSTGTENPPSGGKSRLLAGRDYYNGSVMAPVYPGHRYRITADAKRTAGSVALKAGIWYTKQTSGHAYDSYTASTSSSSLGNDWNRYTWEVTVPSGKQAGSLYFQLEQNASGGSTKWLVGNAILQDITAAYNAQSTANTANTNATNANNRVGNLETCIKMTAQGVRVGKVSNGNFTGYSALVNSAGSFDILNGSGAAITRFTTYGMEIPSSNNGNRDGKFVLTSSGYDLSFVKNGTTYYFRLGSGGIGIHASDGSYVDVGSGGLAIRTNNGNYVNVSPNGTDITSSDGSYISMSKSSGFALDSKAFGKLVCGSNGLQFTNDQGWGLLLSVAGWSIKWAGNHTLATGNEPGALYIDGRRIQVA